MRSLRTMPLALAGLVLSPAVAAAPCSVGDLTGDGVVDVIDVQCHILVTLAAMSMTPPPACAIDLAAADLNGDGSTNVVDTIALIDVALGTCEPEGVLASEDWTRDIVHTDLVVDLSTGAATATLTIAGSATSTGLSLEVGSLDIVSVSALDGALDWTAAAGQLDVGLSTGGDVVVVVDYILSIGNPATGGLLANGSTRTWPVFCGELFPCHSDPADGITYSLDIQGTPRGQGTVYVSSVDTSAPSYMLAWATEDFVTTTLGTTAGGTKLEAHLLGPMSPAVAANSAVVVEAFGWLETHIGPYAFGTRAGAVEVAYPAPVWIGGMEHHPYWHLDTGSTEDPVTMVHEAVHGWYGNGVRMACWEDFVLSEGTVSYLTAVSMGAILGAEYESNVWAYYNFRLSIDPATDTTVAWPDGCGEVDPVEGYTSVPYYKGALFFLAVEAEIGRGSLVAALGSFYQQHVGEAAGMADLLDHIQSETGFDPSALATLWLQSVG